ncbi:hypothetical protein MUK42_04796 [Musa troglodytarum]|uniref:Uncharacterized protein n=1 Tax=Musa troglodytarum TaxID=320322 RepID=A0A9E7KAT7_9LILI|nr:hypothetical protein MUK42_04796 [Musa troglodytarum]
MECWRSMKQVFWKLRSEFRGMTTPLWHRPTSFAYDPRSYSQNFDDGFLHDHLLPCGAVARGLRTSDIS